MVRNLVLGAGGLIILVVLTFIVVSNVALVHDGVDSLVSNSSEEAILIESTTTLSPIGEGITSSEVKAYNNTWLEFDGVNDRVQFPESIESELKMVNSNITISVWLNTTSAPAASSFGSVFGITASCSAASDKWHLGFGNNTDIMNERMCFGSFVTASDALGNSSCITANVTLNKWENYIGRFNGTHCSIYLNGVLNSSAICTTIPVTYSIIKFGHGAFNSACGVNYGLEESRFYNRSLTQSEITEIYNSGMVANSSLPSDGLVLWLPLNEGSGNDVHSFNQSDFT